MLKRLSHAESSSSVFRDMLQGSPTLNSQLLEIHLSDSTMEHSSICRSFLDAVCDGKMPPSTSQGLLHARRLWAFASKYDATVVLSMIRLYIGRAAAVETRLNPGSIFKLGANIGDIEVCCAAIRRNRNWQWSGVTDQTEGMSLKTHGITGKSLFDPAAMPFDHWDSIPSEFIWGLTKAYDPKKDWNAQADEFKRVMTVMRGAFCSILRASRRNRRLTDLLGK